MPIPYAQEEKKLRKHQQTIKETRKQVSAKTTPPILPKDNNLESKHGGNPDMQLDDDGPDIMYEDQTQLNADEQSYLELLTGKWTRISSSTICFPDMKFDTTNTVLISDIK